MIKNILWVAAGVGLYFAKLMIFPYNPIEGYEDYPSTYADVTEQRSFTKYYSDTKEGWSFFIRDLTTSEQQKYDDLELSIEFIAETRNEDLCVFAIVDRNNNVIQNFDELDDSEYTSLDLFYDRMFDFAESCSSTY